MSWVFEHSEATLGDRLVLLAIADHANHDGCDAWPSVPIIAQKARVDRASVFRAIKRLVDLGELEVHSRPGHRNVYRVVICDPSQIATRRILSSKGSQSATGTPLSFKPSEPSLAEGSQSATGTASDGGGANHGPPVRPWETIRPPREATP